MIKSFVMLFFLYTTCGLSRAQTSFMQANQMPLLLNPSLAGAKQKKRICAGYNMLYFGEQTQGNLGFSYDQVLKKLGSAFGVYYLYSENNQFDLEAKKDDFKFYFPPGENFISRSGKHTMGICFSSKFNINSTVIPNKINYTLSPSVFFEYNKVDASEFYNMYYHDDKTMYFSQDFPNGFPQIDSMFVHYNQAIIDINTLKYGMGMQLNSNKLVVLAKLGFENSYIAETVYDVENRLEFFSESYESNFLQYQLFAFEPTAHVGYSFGRNESKFSVTPIVGVGYKHYLSQNQAVFNDFNIVRYSKYVDLIKKSAVNYIHSSANFRYAMCLAGLGYHKYYDFESVNVSLGFQGKWMKIIGNVGHSLSANKRLSLELTSSVIL